MLSGRAIEREIKRNFIEKSQNKISLKNRRIRFVFLSKRWYNVAGLKETACFRRHPAETTRMENEIWKRGRNR